MLVIDAATLYPRFNRGGSLYALDVIDGATIKPLIGEDGRAPEPPDPAYQQILKGVPDAFATLPQEWTADQIRSFQDYFDALMSGNLARSGRPSSWPRRLQADRGAAAAAEGPV